MVLNIVNIWDIPLDGDRKCWICGRLSQLFRVFACKSIENMDLDWQPLQCIHYAKISHPCPCMSCLVVNLGARIKCRHFSKLYANNCVWKNVKIK